jgi:SRSO17 transposase
LEGYAARFDDVFRSLAQRRSFREYLVGLLAPRDRNKTLTALAGAEPVVGAQHPAVQRLHFFLSEARWDHERVNDRRLELLLADPATVPHGGGVLLLDDSGDRKDGTATAHVGHQWLGRLGKTDRGVVTVTTRSRRASRARGQAGAGDGCACGPGHRASRRRLGRIRPGRAGVLPIPADIGQGLDRP